ncbi:MAG: hydantoinase B/oxoprolinase family protein [Dehalococcoidia bacterium]|nr:hydantoinase B/oxoprolinase family protein [Dehalococcoidia bacterium]
MPVDPITLEILRHRLWMINDEMGKVAIQVSASPIVYESFDLNTSLLTAKGDSLFVGVYTSRLSIALYIATRYIIQNLKTNPGINDGDAFLGNDPWSGATHQSDIFMVAPIFWEGEIVCWAGITMHELDVGGMTPGSICVGAKDVYQEGPLISPVKLVEKGRIRKDIEDLVIRNSRTPRINALNFRARLAAINRARERIEQVIREYGKETFLEVQQGIMDLVRQAFERRLGELPDGTWCEEGFIDNDGINNILYRIKLAMTKKGNKLIFDFTGTSPQAPGLINCTRTGLEGGVMSAVLPLLCYDTVWSPSSLEKNVEIIAAPGTLNNASYPAAVSLATLSSAYATGMLAVATIGKMMACSKVYREEAQAAWSPSVQVCNIAGNNTRGEYYNGALTDMAGGGGACINEDGMHTAGISGSPCNSITNIETAESLYPVLYIYRKHAMDVIGPGKYRGGAGTEIMRIPYGNAGPVDCTFYSYGATHPAGKGIYGGYPGSIEVQLILKGTNLKELMAESRMPTVLEEVSFESARVLNSKQRFNFETGDVYVSISQGGNGFGDPLLRDPKLVLKDLQYGLQSREVCRDNYGVITGEGDSVVLEEETGKQREALRKKRLEKGTFLQEMPRKRVFAGELRGQEILSMGEAVKLIKTDRGSYCTCYNCGYVYGKSDKAPQAYAMMRELPIIDLSPVNRYSQSEEIMAREFYCPNCALLIGVEVRKKGDPPVFDTVIDLK